MVIMRHCESEFTKKYIERLTYFKSLKKKMSEEEFHEFAIQKEFLDARLTEAGI
jgi:hypothetical protein